MNNFKDTDLREALRRREAKRPRVEVPDDFLDNVMHEVEAEKAKAWRIGFASLAAAASIAIAVLLVWPRGMETGPGNELLVRKKQDLSPSLADLQPDTIQIVPSNKQAIKKHQNKKVPRQVLARASGIDSLDYYISKIEQQLQQVSESCYAAHAERVIRADERLTRIANKLVLEGLLADSLRQTALF